MSIPPSGSGSVLQTYHKGLIKCLDDLKLQRSKVTEIIKQEELERTAIERKIKLLKTKLETINVSLEKNRELCETYNNTIQQTEHGFHKILESSYDVLNLAQQEASKLSQEQTDSEPERDTTGDTA